MKHLARLGAKVYIASRNEATTAKAIEELQKEGLRGEVLWHKLDLSNPREAKTSAEQFMVKVKRLDVLSTL